MPDVNRVAIIVDPKEPFYSWVRSIEPDAPIDLIGPEDRGTVYLVEVGDSFDSGEVLVEQYATIFEAELDSWYRDRRTWPRRRTYGMFREWFEVRLIDLVFDLSADLAGD
jgi:hypothetical protein